MSEENKALVRRFIDFINKDNQAPIDEFFAPNYTYHNPAFPEVSDLAAIKQFNAAAYSAFPDIRFTLEDMLAEGDRVVYRYSARGTHKGEFLGVAPTRKQVTIAGTVISRIAKGRFQEDWENADDLGLMRQLGLAPSLK
ncbi:MAG TPA: ester cyclase [Candidatus Binataceae bacterium]|nr:ester cyclase [Candidatus Binataceae bacterium]